ncbi:hypothetical protein AAY78_09675 [Microbacterium sp. Ag1]|nr:hypothetical protein AAY78_09675 [Microbacterium sp. Ag1]
MTPKWMPLTSRSGTKCKRGNLLHKYRRFETLTEWGRSSLISMQMGIFSVSRSFRHRNFFDQMTLIGPNAS